MRNILRLFPVMGLFLVFVSGCASSHMAARNAEPVQPVPVAVNPAPSTAGPAAAALKAESEAAKVYKEGQSAYWLGNYAEAISLFSRVKAIDSGYKTKNVDSYLQLASYRMVGEKPGKTKVFSNLTQESRPTSEILINDEQEWLHLIGETEAVLQDAASYLDKVGSSGEVPFDKLIDPNYYLKQARTAFGRKEYLDTIHYSCLVKEMVQAAYNETVAPEKKILGKLGDTPITLNVTDLDLAAALKQIYDLTGVNIVTSQGISGKITMNVTDIPLRQVLDLMVDTNGLKYIEKDNVIRIMTPEEYGKTTAGLAVRNKKVYPLHYAEAKTVAKIVRDSMGIEGVTEDLRSNAIIVDASDIQQAQDIERLVKELDIPANEVLIEAQLLEVSFSKDKALGINFLIQSKMIGDVRLSGPQWGSVPATLPISAESIYFGLTHRDFSAIINALSKEGQVRLLQSPRIMGISGTPATITTQEEIPYSQFNTTSTLSNGVTQTATNRVIATVAVGTTFQIIPLVQNNRTVALNINLIVSRVSQMMNVPLAVDNGVILYDQYPLVSTRTTAQNVVLWDGESLIVGGIMTKNDYNNEVRVPILGRIPILGHLFKQSTLTKTDGELILFLTPHIVQTYEEGRTLTREYEALPSGKELEKGIIGQDWF